MVIVAIVNPGVSVIHFPLVSGPTGVTRSRRSRASMPHLRITRLVALKARVRF